ncbi:MAG: 3-phosphoshikimate 1-carboxyvinyltransferase [Desulfatiglandales bacterium]
MRALKTRSDIDGTVILPGSKSLTHRALIAAALADGKSVLERPLVCEDTTLTAKALRQLGVQMAHEQERMLVTGNGGLFPGFTQRKEIFLGNSGTSYRLILSIVALGRGDYILTGTPRMNLRPIGHLVRALRSLGVDVDCTDQPDHPPAWVRAGGIRGGIVSIPGDISSQHVSSLLLACPYAEEDTEIHVTGTLVSGPYVDMTLKTMERFGVSAEREGPDRFKVKAGQRYRPRVIHIEGDVSSASYFWAAAAVTGGRMVTGNITPHETGQGDISFLDLLAEMGCVVTKGTESVTVRGGDLAGIEADMKDIPDMVPTLAAVALFARGKTFIRNVAHLRYKESDRLKAVAREWRKLGAKVDELSDGLVVQGWSPLVGNLVNPHNDHRLAMSLAVIGLRVPGVFLENDHCVAKSFPSFWELWSRL